MKASIELPPDIFEALQDRAAKTRRSLEDAIIEVLEGALAEDLAPLKEAREVSPVKRGRRVQLPLIRSSHPGTLLSLSGAQVDELLG